MAIRCRHSASRHIAEATTEEEKGRMESHQTFDAEADGRS